MENARKSPFPVLLTRHGISEHNLVTQFYTGRSPSSRLTAEGRAQASALGLHLARACPVDRIIASSLPRTTETAGLIGLALGGVPIHHEAAFLELNKGAWEGNMPRDAVPEPERTEWDERPYHFRFPGGESFADVALRVVPAFYQWIGKFPQERLLFVLHGDVVCALLQQLLQSPQESIRKMLVKPCSLTELERTDGGWTMVRFSDDSFLGGSSEQAVRGKASP